MKRTPELVERAKGLYVREQLTLKEIARRLEVNERTIRTWRDQDGDWNKERQAYLESKKSFHQELYEFGRELMNSIRSDFQRGEKVESNRLYCFGRILPLIVKPKDYEEAANLKRQEADLNSSDLASLIAQAMDLEEPQ